MVDRTGPPPPSPVGSSPLLAELDKHDWLNWTKYDWLNCWTAGESSHDRPIDSVRRTDKQPDKTGRRFPSLSLGTKPPRCPALLLVPPQPKVQLRASAWKSSSPTTSARPGDVRWQRKTPTSSSGRGVSRPPPRCSYWRGLPWLRRPCR